MELENIVKRYRDVGIENQIDYDKFYLYSLHHSFHCHRGFYHHRE